MWRTTDKVKGIVTSVDNGGLEPADRDWILFVIKALIISCLGIFYLMWQMFTRRSPGGSFTLWYLLFGRGRTQIPVQYFRIRDSNQNLQPVRSKGYISNHVKVGDYIVAEGQIRDSVLHLSGGKNLTTGASLRVRRR